MAGQPSDNLVEQLRARLGTADETQRFTYLREVGRELVEEVTPYRELDRGAREIASWLAARPDADEPVLLLFEPGAAFWRAFLGCLYAGVVAVPAPLPHDERSLQRVVGILRDAGSRLVLTTGDLRSAIATGIGGLDIGHQVPCVAVDEVELTDADAWTMPPIGANTVAFLQYTSGSTGAPKGVVVTHRNIQHNLSVLTEYLGADDSWTLVGWIPHFHDMGLISQLVCFGNSGNLVVMSPLAFLKQPVRLLQAISRYRAAATAAPNFAYDLIARRVLPDDVAGLDLSTMRVAFNGAEPVRRRTIETLTELLGPAGWRAEALRPCYGMAEVTLFAAGVPESEAFVYVDADAAALERGALVPAAGRAVGLVSSGKPVPGIDLLIVDPDTRCALADGQVGEIWLRGDSVAIGYYRKPPHDQDAFGAQTADGDGPYLRTGDLGVLHAGHLFVTGRRKDIVIVNGRNLYPHDIEDIVHDVHPATRGSRGVAVTVDADDCERLVVVQSVRTERLGGLSLEQLARTIKVTVSRALEVPAPSVVLSGRAGIHLTTSGKPQRSSMRSAFLRGELTDVLYENLHPSVAATRLLPTHTQITEATR